MNDDADTRSGSPPDDAATPAPAYRVLARKYRPSVFADLIGQQALVRTLTNAFSAGRIAQSYMLTGVRGVGKTTTARLIARALNYSLSEGPSIAMDAMGEHCQAILESRHVDVIEMDAASRTGVEDVREIIEQVRYRPVAARYKVYIIDEVHMLSRQAFNALLKTLEEPPEHVKFIFATTEIRKVPVTVLSRCQRFDLRRVGVDELSAHFARIAELEGVKIDDDAIHLIARAAQGSVRDGLSLLDQAIAYCGDTVAGEEVRAMLGLIDADDAASLFEAVMAGDSAAALERYGAMYAAGADPVMVIADLAGYAHHVTRAKAAPKAPSPLSEVERARVEANAARLPMAALTIAWQILSRAVDEVSAAADPFAAGEMALIRIAYAASLPPPDELARAARDAGAGPSPAPGTASSSTPSPASPQARDGAASTAAGALATAPLAVDEQACAAAPEKPAIASFADLVSFVDARRDIRLRHDLENHVRPVSVSPGRIEIALEGDAPRDLPGALARKLEQWTGERWMVLVASSGGDEPLARTRQAHRAALHEQALASDALKAVRRMFPQSRLMDVREPPSALVEGDQSDSEDE